MLLSHGGLSSIHIYLFDYLPYEVLKFRVGELLASEGRCGDTDVKGPIAGGRDHDS